jgi:MIP family channel proteins
MRRALAEHWPEYLIEAALLGLFMISAGIFTTLIEHPASPVRNAISSGLLRHALTGLAMGLTAIALIYSSWGRRSGAHFNPAVTLTFLRLGKVKLWDAVFYICAQFIGGLLGVLLVSAVLRDAFQRPPVSYVATLPGPTGPVVAFAAEIFISFLLMSTVLFASNSRDLSRFTGLFCGILVALFITFEGPYSGMSMNPARTFSSAAPGRFWHYLWIYFVAPVIGMLLAVETRKLVVGESHRACAKLHHDPNKRCIFCGHGFAKLAALILICSFTTYAQIRPGTIGPIALTVSDLDRSVDFYQHVLSFRKESDCSARLDSFDHLTDIFGTNVRVANLRLGSEEIQLVQYVTPEGRSYPENSHSNDEWFQHIAIVVRDMDEAYAVIRAHHVHQISTEPQTLPLWNKNAAGIRALYFRDPDQHPLELIYFPPGKGDPRWQAPRSDVFIGIDHTAIAVKNTESALSFYRDILGFHVAGESLNYGKEQEHLNHVFGSRVRITGLRASAGPGIELLEYLAPSDGRPFPDGTHPNDLWHVHTTLEVDNLDQAISALQSHHVLQTSPTAGDVTPLARSGTKGLFVKDNDGHEILIRTP